MQQWGNGFFGNPERLALLVVGADAVHLLEVADIAGTDRLTTVHPQLTEVDGTTVEVGHVGYQQFPLSFPTRDGHTARDNGTFAADGQSAVLRTETQGFIQCVGTWREVDGHCFRLT